MNNQRSLYAKNSSTYTVNEANDFTTKLKKMGIIKMPQSTKTKRV